MRRARCHYAQTMEAENIRIEYEALHGFCRSVFLALGLNEYDATQAANVLVASDVRGTPSHGVARLWRYVGGLKTGLMLPDAEMTVLRETPTSLAVRANGAMGAPVSVRTMERVIDKADAAGAAFASVGDSNHFGIAGYYAMLANTRDMIGIAMTNTAALGVPTFGRKVMYGTNPLAFAAPADKEKAFVLDMSTTAVTRGKVEVYDRKEEPLELGWAVDKTGRPASDAHRILDDMFHRYGGGLLPMGGAGETLGGHKGYGLAVMIDVLCAVLGGFPFGTDVFDTAESSGRVSHFFGAIKIDTFRDPAAFRQDMDVMLERLRTGEPAEGEERIYYAGQKEFEYEQETLRLGIPLTAKVYESLAGIGADLGVPVPDEL